jgi:uncharacterized membrane protein
MNGWAVGGTAFLASAVEMVEALTIVLAVGFARGWRIALPAAAWAIVALAGIVALAWPVIVLVPERFLRLAVGAFALYLGAGWLRKAVERAAGVRALRDEAASYERALTSLREQRENRTASLTAFNGVFVEGLEVVFIVIAVGGAGGLAWAAGGALVALLLVLAVGIAVHRPLARVPENAMKFAVGIALVSFGIFWLGEAAGLTWPGDDLALPGLAALVTAAAFGAVGLLRRRAGAAS